MCSVEIFQCHCWFDCILIQLLVRTNDIKNMTPTLVAAGCIPGSSSNASPLVFSHPSVVSYETLWFLSTRPHLTTPPISSAPFSPLKQWFQTFFFSNHVSCGLKGWIVHLNEKIPVAPAWQRDRQTDRLSLCCKKSRPRFMFQCLLAEEVSHLDKTLLCSVVLCAKTWRQRGGPGICLAIHIWEPPPSLCSCPYQTSMLEVDAATCNSFC